MTVISSQVVVKLGSPIVIWNQGRQHIQKSEARGLQGLGQSEQFLARPYHKVPYNNSNNNDNNHIEKDASQNSFETCTDWAGDTAQLVRCLYRGHEVVGSIPGITGTRWGGRYWSKTDMVLHACNLST